MSRRKTDLSTKDTKGTKGTKKTNHLSLHFFVSFVSFVDKSFRHKINRATIAAINPPTIGATTGTQA